MSWRARRHHSAQERGDSSVTGGASKRTRESNALQRGNHPVRFWNHQLVLRRQQAAQPDIVGNGGSVELLIRSCPEKGMNIFERGSITLVAVIYRGLRSQKFKCPKPLLHELWCQVIAQELQFLGAEINASCHLYTCDVDRRHYSNWAPP